MSEQINLLTIQQVSRQFALKESWIRKAVARGDIPHLKINRLVRFDPAELKVWLRARKRV